jgi:ribosomal protein S15P/S13E
MAVRNTAVSSTFEGWRTDTNNIGADAGDVATLTTTATNLTAAINEHETDIATNATNIAANTIAASQASGDSVAMAIALGG